MMKKFKTKWFATIILALVMAVFAGFGITGFYEAKAEDSAQPAPAKVLGMESYFESPNDLIYFSFATDATFLNPNTTSLENKNIYPFNSVYTDYIYLNDNKLVETAAFTHPNNYNAIHMNWAVGSYNVPKIAGDAQYWAISLTRSKLNTGDKLILKRGLHIPVSGSYVRETADGPFSEGTVTYTTLDKDYEFIYSNEYNYPHFYQEDTVANLVYGTKNNDADGGGVSFTIGIDLPFSKPEASLNSLEYFKHYVLFDGVAPDGDDYIHKNLGAESGWDASKYWLKSNTTYLYFFAQRRTITLKQGMIVACGKRLDRDYVFTFNTDSNTWMMDQPSTVTIYSENSNETVATNIINNTVEMFAYFTGYSYDARTDLELEIYYPYFASTVLYNGKPLKEAYVDATGAQILWLHLNYGTYNVPGRSTWMFTVTEAALNACETTPTVTFPKGMRTECGYLDKTYNFTYDKTTQKWSLVEEVKSVTLCDENGNAVATPTQKEIFLGDAYDLPKYARLNLSSDRYKVVDVTWDKETFDTAGSYTVTGTVNYDKDKNYLAEGVSETFSVPVTVNDYITGINAIEAIDTYYGDETGLPTGVTATMASGATYELDVTWNDVTDNKFTPTEVKTYTFNGAAIAGNYLFKDENVLNVSVKVIAAKAEITVTAKSYTIGCGDELPSFAYEITSGSLVDGDTLNITYSCEADGTKEGVFDIIASGESDKYEITFVNGKLTVSDYIKSIATFESVDMTYGQTVTLPAVVTATFASGATAELNVDWTDYEDGTFKPTASGEFTVNGVATAGDYAVADGLSLNVTLNVVVGKISITVTAKSYTIKFGDDMPTFEYEITAGALLAGDTLNITYSCGADGESAGEFDIIASGESDKYEITFVNGSLTIQDCITSVGSYEPASMTYGQSISLPSTVSATMASGVIMGISITWTGYENGIFKPATSGEFTINGVANAGANLVSTGVSLNVSVTVTVEKAAITVTVKSVTIGRGETVPTFEYEVTEGQLAEGDELNLTYACEADGIRLGEFEISASGESEKYDITYVNGVLTVDKGDVAGCLGAAGFGGESAILFLIALCAVAVIRFRKISANR